MVPTRPRVFLDFSINDVSVGRVVFELFAESTPKTCENFRALCTGEKGLSALSDRPLYYKNSIVHRSIKGFMIQAGDFTKRNGTGGESIFGSPFPDENLARTLDSSGLLCMANKGPNTNGSQFFITLRDCSHLNGKHVVFGKVIKGFEEVVCKIAELPVDDKDRPTVPVVIANCGELELRTRKKADPMEGNTKRPRSVSDSDVRQGSILRPRRSFTPDTNRPRHHKKVKHTKGMDRFHQDDNDMTLAKGLAVETEEEYDARLEREEAERHETERKQALERIKKLYSDSTRSKDGVRFKGRGRMKFVDPETRHERRE